MPPDNSVYRGKADPEASEEICPGKAFEGCKDLLRVCHAESLAIVTDEKGAFCLYFSGADVNDGMPVYLPGITDEILQNGPHQPLIRIGRHPLRDVE